MASIEKSKLNKNYSSIIKTDSKIKENKYLINEKKNKLAPFKQDYNAFNMLNPDSSSRQTTRSPHTARSNNTIKVPFIKLENLNTSPNPVKIDLNGNFKAVFHKKDLRLDPTPNSERRAVNNKY